MEKITSNCCGCSACLNVCPRKCITMIEHGDGYKYPVIDRAECISCGKCRRVCPNNTPIVKKQRTPKTYAVKSKNEILRLSASSGGVFPIFANQILKNNGIVYGVAMANDCKSALFDRVESYGEVEKLYGSKYFQADVGFTYQKVEADLKSGKVVLFSGTPCHILALKQYLKKDYPGLICVEVLCHGVTSSQLWRKYIEYIEDKWNEDISYVNFRSKKNGWHNFELEIKGKTASTSINHRSDPFMKMFLDNGNLRRSCYYCNAKQTESKADITCGDFWRIDKILPEWDDDKGTSIVLVQTEKGQRLLSCVADECYVQEVDFRVAIQSCPTYYFSERKPMFRRLICWYTKHKDGLFIFESLIHSKVYKRLLLRPFPNFRKLLNK